MIKIGIWKPRTKFFKILPEFVVWHQIWQCLGGFWPSVFLSKHWSLQLSLERKLCSYFCYFRSRPVGWVGQYYCPHLTTFDGTTRQKGEERTMLSRALHSHFYTKLTVEMFHQTRISNGHNQWVENQREQLFPGHYFFISFWTIER